MCGIGGYNISPDWAIEHLDSSKMHRMLDTFWEYNLHRGKDAAGFFLESAEADEENNVEFLFFKQPGSAEDILKSDEYDLTKIPVSRVFGAHTRASTIGLASMNENNHPVNWGTTWVTHNGHISNHMELRKHIPNAQRPLVDSHAIAVVLDEAGDPWNLNDLVEGLKKLQGGYAIHAVWEQAPGLSLLARGANSPLVVRWHKDIGVFYSSEPEASWTVLEDLGLHPEDTEQWEICDMEDYTAMLFYNGQPLDWASWMPALQSNVRGPTEYVRTFANGAPIFSSDWTRDFSATAVRSFQEIPEDAEPELQMEKGKPAGKEVTRTFPYFNGDWLGARAAEADSMYAYDSLRFIFIKNIQIVTDASGKILDIIDQSKKGDRWSANVTNHRGERLDTFHAFLDEYSTYVRDPKERVLSTHADNERQKRNAAPVLPFMKRNAYDDWEGWTNWNDDLDAEWAEMEAAEARFEKDLEPGSKVDRKNFSILWQHKHDSSLRFRKNMICAIHGQSMTNHLAPLKCPEVLAAALEVYTCFDRIDLFLWLDNDVSIALKPSENMCQGPCFMEPKYFVTAHLKPVNKAYMLPKGEECTVCGSTRWLSAMPFWIDDLLSGKLEYVK